MVTPCLSFPEVNLSEICSYALPSFDLSLPQRSTNGVSSYYYLRQILLKTYIAYMKQASPVKAENAPCLSASHQRQ